VLALLVVFFLLAFPLFGLLYEPRMMVVVMMMMMMVVEQSVE
jgi:hypothetical protein